MSLTKRGIVQFKQASLAVAAGLGIMLATAFGQDVSDSTVRSAPKTEKKTLTIVSAAARDLRHRTQSIRLG